MASRSAVTSVSSTICLSILIIFFTRPAASQDRYIHDLKIKYYTDYSMTCDHPGLNISDTPSDVRSITWIFPDGKTVDASTHLNPRKFRFFPLASQAPGPFDVYNLTAYEVDQDVYGYYSCIVVYKDTLSRQISVVRWGLNVNGADFSDLTETYKENAIIGGIAAGVLFAIVGVSCIVWHFRFANRNGNGPDEDDQKVVVVDALENGVSKKEHHAFNNSSFVADDNAAETQFGEVKDIEAEIEPELNEGDPNFKIARHYLN